jgi:hypothetical protein
VGLALLAGAARDEVPDRDIAHEQRGQQDARQDAGDEQLGDRFVHRHAVDDEDDRWRDEQPERAGAGQCADHHAGRVVAPQQFRHRHLSDGEHGGGGGAADGGEQRRAGDVDVQHAAGQRLEPWREAAEQVFR